MTKVSSDKTDLRSFINGAYCKENLDTEHNNSKHHNAVNIGMLATTFCKRVLILGVSEI